MIMRVLTGKLRPGIDADTRHAAFEDAVKACQAAEGCRNVFFVDPPDDREGVLALMIWDSLEEAGRAIGGSLQHGLSSFSILLQEPPRGRYYQVAATAKDK